MKKLLLFIALGLTTLSQAQVEIKQQAAYTFDDSFQIDYGDARIYGSYTWGLSLGFEVRPNYEVRVEYTNQESILNVKQSFPYGRDVVNVRVHYVQLAPYRLFPVNDKVIPFAGMKLGAAIIEDVTNEYSTRVRFAIGGELGTKIMLTDFLGIHLNMGLQMPVQGAGISFWAGSGGAGGGVSTYSTIFQFYMGGGLIVRLGE